VIGLASEANHEWLAGHGCFLSPTATGWPTGSGMRPGRSMRLSTRSRGLRAAGTGAWRQALAGGHDRQLRRGRAVRSQGRGQRRGASASVLAELAELNASGQLEIPIAATFPLTEVQDAYRLLAQATSAARSSWCPERPGASIRGGCLHQLPLFTSSRAVPRRCCRRRRSRPLAPGPPVNRCRVGEGTRALGHHLVLHGQARRRPCAGQPSGSLDPPVDRAAQPSCMTGS